MSKQYAACHSRTYPDTNILSVSAPMCFSRVVFFLTNLFRKSDFLLANRPSSTVKKQETCGEVELMAPPGAWHYPIVASQATSEKETSVGFYEHGKDSQLPGTEHFLFDFSQNRTVAATYPKQAGFRA